MPASVRTLSNHIMRKAARVALIPSSTVWLGHTNILGSILSSTSFLLTPVPNSLALMS